MTDINLQALIERKNDLDRRIAEVSSWAKLLDALEHERRDVVREIDRTIEARAARRAYSDPNVR